MYYMPEYHAILGAGKNDLIDLKSATSSTTTDLKVVLPVSDSATDTSSRSTTTATDTSPSEAIFQ